MACALRAKPSLLAPAHVAQWKHIERVDDLGVTAEKELELHTCCFYLRRQAKMQGGPPKPKLPFVQQKNALDQPSVPSLVAGPWLLLPLSPGGIK